MTEDQTLSLLLSYGPLGVFAGLCIWFALRYGPRIIEGHLSLTKTCESTQIRIADAMETMSNGQDTSTRHHAKTHAALSHIVNAQKEITDCPEAHRELERARDALRSP